MGYGYGCDLGEGLNAVGPGVWVWVWVQGRQIYSDLHGPKVGDMSFGTFYRGLLTLPTLVSDCFD